MDFNVSTIRHFFSGKKCRVFETKYPEPTGDFQKKTTSFRILNVPFPAPKPRHGVGSPGDDGTPPRGWHL